MALAKFAPLGTELIGFDSEVVPNYLMVPLKGERYLQIQTVGADVAGVETTPRGIVEVARAAPPGRPVNARRVYRFAGLAPGAAQVIVRGPGRSVLGRLDIGVKPRRTPAVQFFLVSDKKGRKTSTAPAHVEEMVTNGNKILLPQANVTLTLKAVRPVTIDRDLGDPIRMALRQIPYVRRETPEEENWHAITDVGDVNRDVFNVFCVWSFVNTYSHEQYDAICLSKVPVSASEMSKTGVTMNMCMMQGAAALRGKDLGRLFAHEAGHYLDRLPFHHERTKDGKEVHQDKLMRDGLGGDRLTKRDIEAMNPPQAR